MSMNRLGGTALENGAMPLSLAPGEVFMLPSGQGISLSAAAQAPTANTTGWTLTSQYEVILDGYISLQVLDPLSQQWRNFASSPNGPHVHSSDGASWRLANTTGCPIGALITNGGSGLTNGYNTVAVTPSAGGSTWNTLVGGSINNTITITNGGANYVYPPIIVFTPPSSQGTTPCIMPTAVCTISGGVINSITVVNQGAGLTGVPGISIINQPGDTTGGGAVLTINATLANSGALTAMWPATYGSAVTAVPTFTFSPASTIAATAIMNFTVTGMSVTGAGTGFGTSPFIVLTTGGQVAGTQNTRNPQFGTGLVQIRPAVISGTASADGITATGLVVRDGGFGYEAIPSLAFISAGGLAATAASATATVGGVNGTAVIQPI